MFSISQRILCHFRSLTVKLNNIDIYARADSYNEHVTSQIRIWIEFAIHRPRCKAGGESGWCISLVKFITYHTCFWRYLPRTYKHGECLKKSREDDKKIYKHGMWHSLDIRNNLPARATLQRSLSHTAACSQLLWRVADRTRVCVPWT